MDVMILAACSIELPYDAVSDTTADDSSSERWLHDPKKGFI
jgi:hypothetical protein